MYAFGNGTHHGNIIKEIVKNTSCNNYLELGIYDGLNISEIAPFVKRAVGVDFLDKREYFNYEFIQSSTDDFFINNNEIYDIIFIDADHNVDSVKKDLENSLKILNKHGIIFLHDTHPKESYLLDPGYCNNCYQIINYIKEYHPELELINLPISEAGLTIVNRKNEYRHLNFLS